MANITGYQQDYVRAYEEMSKDTNVFALLMLTETSYGEKEKLSEYKLDPKYKAEDYNRRMDIYFKHMLSTFFKVDRAGDVYETYKDLFKIGYLDNTNDDTNDYRDETMVKLNKIYSFINNNSFKDFKGSELLREIRKEINGVDEGIVDAYYDASFNSLKEQSDMIRNESNLETKMSYIPNFFTELADMEIHLFRSKLFYDDYRKSVTGLMNYLLLRARLPLIYVKPIELDNYYDCIKLSHELFDNDEIGTFYKEKMCDSIENNLIVPMKNSIAHYVDVNNKKESGLLDNKILSLKQNKYK